MKANIGCGPNMFPVWWNSDRVDMGDYLEQLRSVQDFTGWPEHQVNLANHVKAGRVGYTVHDLRDGFSGIETGSLDAIYLGQMIEHLSCVHEAPKFLAECLRMLKPGAPIRITTPDLDILVDAYNEGTLERFASEQPAFYAGAPPGAQFSFLVFGASGENCTRENFEGHFVCYTREHMRMMLEQIGFVDVRFDGEPDPALPGWIHMRSAQFTECVDAGMSHSFGCEARKP